MVNSMGEPFDRILHEQINFLIFHRLTGFYMKASIYEKITKNSVLDTVGDTS